MLRYNMAHRRVGRMSFPHTARSGVPVVAFAATRWGTLLVGHSEWMGPVPCAVDCYHYCLAEPAVSIVLTAPSSTEQLRANLATLDGENVLPESVAQWDSYGDLIHAGGRGSFDTLWS